MPSGREQRGRAEKGDDIAGLPVGGQILHRRSKDLLMHKPGLVVGEVLILKHDPSFRTLPEFGKLVPMGRMLGVLTRQQGRLIDQLPSSSPLC